MLTSAKKPELVKSNIKPVQDTSWPHCYEKGQKKTENDTTSVPVNDTINTVIDPVNVPVNVPEINLSDKERQVLDFIIKKNNITAKEIAEKIGVSDKTVKRAISTLKTNGLIVRIGSDKKGFWSVKDCIID